MEIKGNFATYLLGAQPKVYLLDATPEWVVAQATKGYTGVYTSKPLSTDDHNLFWKELGDTKLKTPLEFAHSFWLLEDVDRGFTHQLVRYRFLSIVQESQRFSVQEGEKARIVVPKNIAQSSSELEKFIEHGEATMQAYLSLIADGMPVQDARSLLPTNIVTRLYISASIKTLIEIYTQRACCQAQSETWSQVTAQFKHELSDNGYKRYSQALLAPWEDKRCTSCGFGSGFDRPCSRKNLFDANVEALYWSTSLMK